MVHCVLRKQSRHPECGCLMASDIRPLAAEVDSVVELDFRCVVHSPRLPGITDGPLVEESESSLRSSMD